MKRTLLLVLPAVVLGMRLFAGESQPVKLEALDVRGPVTYTTAGDAPRPLAAGAALATGTVIKTGVGAAVDLSLGRQFGVVRLAQNSVLSLDKLEIQQGNKGVLDVQLSLVEGTLLGDMRELPPETHFEVKTLTGIAGLRGGRFRIQPTGHIVVISGSMLYVHIPRQGAEPVLHKLNAPPPMFFAPEADVGVAPSPLVKEVQAQIQARVRAP